MKGIGKKELVGNGGRPSLEKDRDLSRCEIRGGRKPKLVPLRRASRSGDILSIQCCCICAMVVDGVQNERVCVCGVFEVELSITAKKSLCINLA
jgi:hypothetical protein